MALNKRERALLVTTITVLVTVGSYFLLVPQARHWKELGRDLQSARDELKAMKATVAHQSEWRASYNELSKNLGEHTERFEQTSDVLKKIEEVGIASGVIITSRRSLQPVDKDVYRELPVQCNIEATIDSLVKFLHALQTGAGFMSVEQLQITPRADNTTILRCDIQVRALSGKSGVPRS